MRTIMLALAAAVSLSACATGQGASESASARDCFFAEQINGFEVVDDQSVQIRVGASDRYVLTTLFNTRDLDWSNSIALRSTTGSICTGGGVGVEIIGGDPRRTYPVQSIARAPEPAPEAQNG